MICWEQGGRRGALLLVLSWSASAQISVINGLAHFHPCGSRGHGEILVHNSLDTSVTVLLEVEHLGESPKISIPSEWVLDAGERGAIPYQWIETDSSSQRARIGVYPLYTSPVTRFGGWAVQTQLRYVVSLYRGCLSPSPENEVRAEWDSTLTWQMVGPHFWSAQVQAYGALGEAIEAPFNLFLAPFGTSVSQPVPPGTAYVVARDSRGHQVGCKRP